MNFFVIFLFIDDFNLVEWGIFLSKRFVSEILFIFFIIEIILWF